MNRNKVKTDAFFVFFLLVNLEIVPPLKHPTKQNQLLTTVTRYRPDPDPDPDPDPGSTDGSAR